jgi:hypothetical protein
MENLGVYRVRFELGAPVMSKSDQHEESRQEANSAPLAPNQSSGSE